VGKRCITCLTGGHTLIKRREKGSFGVSRWIGSGSKGFGDGWIRVDVIAGVIGLSFDEGEGGFAVMMR